MSSYTVFHIYNGLDGDADYAEYSEVGFPVPRIGEEVTAYTLRDEDGNFTLTRQKRRLFGVVIRIEHVFEERKAVDGRVDIIHFVEVFLKSD